MKPVKQAIDVSFAKGLDEKTDPKRVAIGNFVSLENTIFDIGGLLQKRNGYAELPSLPDATYAYLTTLNDNLTAVGTSIAAYNSSSMNWVKKGSIQPMRINTLPLLRNNFNQTAVDAVIAPNGLICTVYIESHGGSTVNKYAISDSVTGQNIIAPTLIPVTSGTVSGGMRVFLLRTKFIIVFTNLITAVNHLQYIAIDVSDPTTVTTNTDIASSYVPAQTLSWDGFVANNYLYIAYDTLSGGQSVDIIILRSDLSFSSVRSFVGFTATQVSVTADTTSGTTIYLSFYDSSSQNGYTAVLDQNINVLVAPVLIVSALALANITSAAQNGQVQIFGEVVNAYGYDGAIPTNYIDSVTVNSTGAIIATVQTIRSVGLASKAFIIDGVIYFLAAYQSPYQPTYFLINGTESLASNPIISAKLAYENGGGYLTHGLPGVTVKDSSAFVPYLFKDLIAAVNKDTNVPTGTQVNGIYSQTGINLGTFNLGTEGLDSAEIAQVLHISGGFLWMYDGQLPVEHNFFLWPDSIEASWSTTGGSIAAQPDGSTNTNAYFYQVTYEWTDNQGNAYRSAPSIPISVTTTGNGSTGSITLHVPTLRLTYKIASPVKIVIYRWSVAQEIYYQVTSISTPTLNSTTVDAITYVDTLSDATILGNNIIYTTGGVVEDVNAPATNLITLFDTRLWLVDAEDQNLLWFSKQVIEATPVEMSDLFTIFVAPTTGAQGSTGPITALSVMDDKLIIFKRNAIYYINGSGPDNTGANTQYSPPTFVTATVGCDNQQSIVFTPDGLQFQSDKGIWLLGRNMQTSYIGSSVQKSTLTAIVKSAQNIPATNQVRFILDSGITLMYDYFYGQWGSFTGVPAISSTIFEELYTFINAKGETFQESPGEYLDGGTPVLMSFTTGPLRLDKIASYQRSFFFYLLGEYLSPHKLQVGISYDYATEPSQVILISPTNFAPAYGAGASSSPYGQGNPYGGPSSLLDWRIFLERQRCMAFAISIQEIFDSTFGASAGAGLTLSGLNVVCGLKSPFKTQSAQHTAG